MTGRTRRQSPDDRLDGLREHADALRDQALSFLESLVNMDSPTESKTDIDRVGDVLQEHLSGLGFSVLRDRQQDYGDHIVARREGNRSKPTVLLVGHFDTVYPIGTTKLRPFRIDGDRAYGPGALDMKGGLTVGLEAVRVLDEVLPDNDLNLVFVMNSDEEPGSPTSRPLIRRVASDCDYALVLEPGDPVHSITTARKGVGIFRLVVTGRSAHAGAEPEKGASAILELAHKILEVQAVARPGSGTTVNVGAVSGGRFPYVVADSASAAIDVRVMRTAEADRVVADFQRIAEVSHTPGTSASIEGTFHRPPFNLADDQLLWKIAKSLGHRVGLKLMAHMTGGASDANNISAQGVPTLDGLGPNGEGAHSPDEHFLVSTFTKKIGLVSSILACLSHEDLRDSLLDVEPTSAGTERKQQ